MLYCMIERNSVKRCDEKNNSGLSSNRKKTCRRRSETAASASGCSLPPACNRNRLSDPLFYRDPLCRLRYVQGITRTVPWECSGSCFLSSAFADHACCLCALVLPRKAFGPYPQQTSGFGGSCVRIHLFFQNTARGSHPDN